MRASTPAVGVLMLATRFPRIAGDIGHPASLPFPARYRVVAGASPQRVVRAATGRTVHHLVSLLAQRLAT